MLDSNGKRIRLPVPKTLMERWWLRVDSNNVGTGCWEWTGAKWSRGYGKITVGKSRISAHKFGYENLVGPIPKGLELDHLCRNHSCVNPSHLEPVTHIENVNRGCISEVHRKRFALITHCPIGHEYNSTNTYYSSRGSRNCRACDRCRQSIRRK